MKEGDKAVFHVGELDCEIEHKGLQPCHPALCSLEFRCYGHARFMKIHKEVRNPLWHRQKLWKSYREEVKEYWRKALEKSRCYPSGTANSATF